jgi:hypothetical protein
MTCSTECPASLDGKQKHQMRVTHSAWASTVPGNPRSGPRLSTLLAGVAVSVRAESGASRKKWRRATNVCSVGHRKVEKELSMRPRERFLLAKRLHERASAHTVEAEKGNLWRYAA